MSTKANNVTYEAEMCGRGRVGSRNVRPQAFCGRRTQFLTFLQMRTLHEKNNFYCNVPTFCCWQCGRGRKIPRSAHLFWHEESGDEYDYEVRTT